jgi:anti-anti-sigma factor
MERLALVGEIDVGNCEQIFAGFLAAIDGLSASERDSLVELEIDCSEMTFIDSSGLGALVRLHKKTGLNLVLTNVSEQCRRPFTVTQLDTLFEIR